MPHNAEGTTAFGDHYAELTKLWHATHVFVMDKDEQLLSNGQLLVKRGEQFIRQGESPVSSGESLAR